MFIHIYLLNNYLNTVDLLKKEEEEEEEDIAHRYTTPITGSS